MHVKRPSQSREMSYFVNSPKMEARQSKEGLQLLRNIHEELKRSNDFHNKEHYSKDGVKYMVWYKDRKEHITVFVRVSFVGIGDIDAVKQKFQCEFYMNLRWKEPTLLGKTSEDHIDWDSVWDPGVYIIDAVNFDIHERHQELRAAKLHGEPPDVIQYYHIKGTFKEVLKVNDFPFDYQDLSLMLTSNWHADQVTLAKDPEKDDNIHIWNFTAQQEWDLQRHVIAESKTLLPQEGTSSNSYPQYRIRLNVMRRYSFYLYNVAFIMCLITLLTFTSFAVKTDAVGDRIQITLTLLLTSVAFKYYAQQFVPTVSYLTFLDKYVMTCMVFQFLVAIYNAVSGMVTSPSALYHFEWVSFSAALAAFLLIHAIFGVKCCFFVKKNKRKMVTDKERYHNENTAKVLELKRQEELIAIPENGIELQPGNFAPL